LYPIGVVERFLDYRGPNKNFPPCAPKCEANEENTEEGKLE